MPIITLLEPCAASTPCPGALCRNARLKSLARALRGWISPLLSNTLREPCENVLQYAHDADAKKAWLWLRHPPKFNNHNLTESANSDDSSQRVDGAIYSFQCTEKLCGPCANLAQNLMVTQRWDSNDDHNLQMALTKPMHVL